MQITKTTKRVVALALCATLGWCTWANSDAAVTEVEEGKIGTEAAEKVKSDYTIKEIMKIAGKGGLNKKVASGEATDADKKQLLNLYIAMFEAKPPRGEEGSWMELAGGATLAAAKVAVGREGAEKELAAAFNCKACHANHKPK